MKELIPIKKWLARCVIAGVNVAKDKHLISGGAFEIVFTLDKY